MSFETGETGVPLLHEELSGLVRQTAFEVHQYFGPGFLEKVYANALAHRLLKKGVEVQQGQKLLVHDEDGTMVGEYETDLLVDGRALVEVKAAKSLVGGHVAQLLHCLKGTGTRLGLLVNFGAPRLEFKRYVLGYEKVDSPAVSMGPGSLSTPLGGISASVTSPQTSES